MWRTLHHNILRQFWPLISFTQCFAEEDAAQGETVRHCINWLREPDLSWSARWTLEELARRRMLTKLTSIMGNTVPPIPCGGP